MVGALPPAARRWLTHAIAPGTPLWQSVELQMRGEVRIGRWRPFSARQVLAPGRGFIRAATTRVMGVPVVGYDRLSSGTGQMRWRLAGAVPVLSATGADVTHSAAGRLAGEMVLVPTTFSGAIWTAGHNPDQARATWRVGSQDQTVELGVAQDGRLLTVTMHRWGNPSGKPFGRHPFGVAFDGELTSDGVTITSGMRAGWWWGTQRAAEGEFFRAQITSAVFR